MSTAALALKSRYGPWAVVTGASDGIGLAFARYLAAEGFNIVLVARREDRLKAIAVELMGRHSIECRVLAEDLSQLQAVKRVVNGTIDLDIGLVVAAAGFGTSGPMIYNELAQEANMTDVNCRAVMAQAWYFGQRFARRGRGGLVFMSSLLAFQGTPHAANYAATKAYVQTLAEGLRAELAPMGVDVIASAPGPITTRFAARANMRMAKAMGPDVVARVTLQALGRKTTVRPGWRSKLLGWSLAMLPRWGQVMVIAQVMRGMTAYQDRITEQPDGW